LVMVSSPHGAPPAAVKAAAENVQTAPAPVAPSVTTATENAWTWILRVFSIALAIASWGAYGPVLHKGQAAMHHSRLRPLICVGFAYFVIAVIVPYFFLGEMGEASTYRSVGTLWSILGGTFGAVGALGIILAFNSGGRPVFVMPLVFGGAPVINTLVSISSTHQWSNVNPFFWAGLILVVVGAAMVLAMAPRGDAPVAVPATS